MPENRRYLFPLFIVGGGILLVLAGIASIFANRPATQVTTPTGVIVSQAATPTHTTASQVKTATPATASQVQRVTLDDAKVAYDLGEATFLDVRDSSSFAAGHVPGAVNITVADLDQRMSELNPQAWIIPYCT